MKNDNYHLGQLNRPVSQIDVQRNMVGPTLYIMHNFWLLMSDGDVDNGVFFP